MPEPISADTLREPDYERIFRDPANVFGDPMDVLRHPEILDSDKRQILRRWEQMVRSGQDGNRATLAFIRDALDRLGSARQVAVHRIEEARRRVD